MKATSIAALTAALASASILAATPAYADSLSSGGSYTVTITGPNGQSTSQIWDLTPCGANCLQMDNGKQLHRQGNIWSCPPDEFGYSITIDETSMTGTEPNGLFVSTLQLTKRG